MHDIHRNLYSLLETAPRGSKYINLVSVNVNSIYQ